MSPEAFKYVLNREEYTKITTENMDEAKNMLHVCFGKDTQLRKDLLIDEEEIAPDPDAVLKTGKVPTKNGRQIKRRPQRKRQRRRPQKRK